MAAGDVLQRSGRKLGEILHKGMQISVSGTLMRREWTSQDGRTGESWGLDNARFLGIVPKPQNASQASQVARTAPQTQNAGAYSSGGNMAPQNGAQGFGNDPAGNLMNDRAAIQRAKHSHHFNEKTLHHSKGGKGSMEQS